MRNMYLRTGVESGYRPVRRKALSRTLLDMTSLNVVTPVEVLARELSHYWEEPHRGAPSGIPTGKEILYTAIASDDGGGHAVSPKTPVQMPTLKRT
jgi:hypothetical protein